MTNGPDPAIRIMALQVAMAWWNVHGRTPIRTEVLDLADTVASWADPAAPVELVIHVDLTTYQQSNHAPSATIYGGKKVQLTDTQQVTLSVEATDSKGQPVTEDAALTWSESSGGQIISLQVAPDNMSCLVVAGNVGTGAVVTVGDGTRTATMSFDVIAGDIAALNVTAGTPEDQPPAPTG
jgi:hypothetical protein